MDEREATAYHEAGHAVITWSQRRAFQFVTVEKGEDFAGLTQQRAVPDWAQPDVGDPRAQRWIHDAVRSSWAGLLAEAIYRGDPEATDPQGNDRFTIIELAPLPGEAASAYIEQQRLHTLKKLQHPHIWRAVEALAAALLTQHTIEWRDAKQIIQAAVAPQSVTGHKVVT
ncbi:MAG: hypothetical protein ABIJ48_06965 [Actinomycetota bacterium]